MLTVGYVIAALIGAGIAFIGARVFWAPQAASGFGIPGMPTGDRAFRAWLTVKGGRDIGAGLLLLVVLAGATPHLLGWYLLVAAIMPITDALIVWRAGGPKAAVYGVHGATALVMIAGAVLLLVA
jgi:hypothetical protein